MSYLTDITILIALLDRNHQNHMKTVNWFLESGRHDWATSPTIKNGVIRIMSGRGYQLERISPAEVAGSLRSVVDATRHEFIHDDLSILRESCIDLTGMRRGGNVTDTYLLALAVAHDLTFVTLDRKIDASVVTDATAHLLVIE